MDWITLTNQEVQKDLMPPVCVHCGGPATGRHNKTYEWHPEWIDTFYWLGFFPGLIAESFNRREKRVSLPVCDNHDPEKQPKTSSAFWRILQMLLLWLSFTGLGTLIAFLTTLSALPPNRDDLLEKRVQLEKQQVTLVAELAKAGYPDANPDQLLEKWKQQSPAKELSFKAEQLKQVQNDIGRVEKDLETADTADLHPPLAVQEWYKSPLVIGGGIGAALGLLLFLPGAFPRQPGLPKPAKKLRSIQIQEITDDGISLFGLDDAFVKAMLEQRERKS